MTAFKRKWVSAVMPSRSAGASGRTYPCPLCHFRASKGTGKGFENTARHTSPLPLAINSEPLSWSQKCLIRRLVRCGLPIGALGNPS